ncbi:phosphatidic acid phosphatase type 2/haloperoxidase [Mycena rosella]|uniref:Phosphatidic acid phosphatase type 2/haloperoxidase n=1 Tax=Mycena rosella TaxID=1033263 RepID=A0AAD7DN97_MYCRO|nr:phosphatidic acid phosphatase type 2/haloperoxidase [Mycena rosella]
MPYIRLLEDHHDEFESDSAMPATTRTSQLLMSYAPDWLITLALAAVFFSLDAVHGFRRQFSLEDTSLRHTYAVHERVPNIALYMIAIVAPVVLQALINLLTIRSWWDLHNGLLGLVLSLSITGSVTQFTKLTVGRPRPDIIDRCQPIPGSVDPIYGLSNSSICTTPYDSALMLDAFRSFPSGHSSLSFAGLGFLAFYLAGKLHLFDHRGYAAKAWVSLVPFAGAALVAISRTMDNRHHWHDVLVGSLLGTVVSYFCYRQYYPSLASEVSHRPYSPRIARDDIPTHTRRTSSRQAYGGHPTADDIITGGPLEGTVLRQGPGSLREVWRDSHEHEETSALGAHRQPENGAIPLDSV